MAIHGNDEPSSEDVHPADALAQRASEALSQGSSRRGFLAKVGRVAFATLGITVVSEILPTGRDAARAATLPCGSDAMCGFCGSQCGCSNCSGDSSTCPPCACTGGWWESCCDLGPENVQYRYRDCFSHGDPVNGPCGATKINHCLDCGGYCCNNPNAVEYFGQTGCSGQYMCTRVIALGAC